MRSATADGPGRVQRVSGSVLAAGTVFVGTGFTVVKTGTGAYSVYCSGFRAITGGSATPRAGGQVAAANVAGAGNILGIATTTSSTGAAADGGFDFTAEGIAL